MQENYTVLDEQKFYDKSAMFKGRKPAKLSTYKVFYPKTIAIQNSIKNNIKTEISQNVSQNINQTQVSNQVQGEVNVQPTKPVDTKPISDTSKVENNVVNFPSKEILEEKANKLNATFYNDIPAKVINLETYRRLRVNALIVAILNHVRKVAAIDNNILLVQKEEPITEQPIDFSQFPNVLEFPNTNNLSELEEAKEIPETKTNDDNIVRLENYLSQGTTTIEQNEVKADDSIIIEINSLTKEKENTKDSLATQKEILANLRKRIEQNKVLCEARKQELVEENMALTQELNDVLSEINQLTDIASQQEAFLGIQHEDEIGYGKRVA